MGQRVESLGADSLAAESLAVESLALVCLRTAAPFTIADSLLSGPDAPNRYRTTANPTSRARLP